jgi:hypothetical protein
MKKSLLPMFFLCCVSFLFAAAASATPTQFHDNPPPQCPYASVDLCFSWGGDGTGGWPYTDPSSCTGGQCLVCALDNGGYREYCLSITMSASCSCEIYKPEGSGPNITACRETGQCTYRH